MALYSSLTSQIECFKLFFGTANLFENKVVYINKCLSFVMDMILGLKQNVSSDQLSEK